MPVASPRFHFGGGGTLSGNVSKLFVSRLEVFLTTLELTTYSCYILNIKVKILVLINVPRNTLTLNTSDTPF